MIRKDVSAGGEVQVQNIRKKIRKDVSGGGFKNSEKMMRKDVSAG